MPITTRYQLGKIICVAALLTVVASCRRTDVDAPADVEQKAAAVPLRLIVVDDPPLARAIAREWKARAEGELLVTETTAAELLARETIRLGADAIIYPSALIGTLAERQWLAAIDSEPLNDPRLARRDIFLLSRLREVAWGEQIFAVPFGSPQLTLHLRRDLLAERRLEPPDTWETYLAVARKLAAKPSSAADESAWWAVAEPLADGWAGQVLLARAAAYARHRSQYSTLFDSRTMEPLIAGPPFVRALTELAAVAALGPDDLTSLDPAAVRAGFNAGKYGMALSWPTRATAATGDAPTLPATAFAELPGAGQVYNFRTGDWESRSDDEEPRVTLLAVAGRLGSLTRECRRTQASLNLLFFLSGNEVGQEIAPESTATTIYRWSQLAGIGRWLPPGTDTEAARQYARAVEAAATRDVWLSSIRIPGRDDYLRALDDAVQRVVDADAAPAEALQEAAAEWSAITAELGLEAQRAAYLKSLGLQ